MTKQRFLSKGSLLTEVWCPGAGPKARYGWSQMKVGDMVEQTDVYEIYECEETDAATGMVMPCRIKVYLDDAVKAGGGLHLGTSSDIIVDGNGGAMPKAVVYEIVNREDDAPESQDSAGTPTLPVFKQIADAETGEVYDVDEDDYVWENGEKTNKWFTSDGKLVNPNNVSVEAESLHYEEDKKPKGPFDKLRTGFAAVAGMDDLKAEMLDEVKFVLDNPEKAKRYGLHMPNGMLLYGYPGCGKTFFAEKLAEELNVKFLFKRGSDVCSKFMHETSGRISDLFKEARSYAPCILCIDEIDGLVPYRRAGDAADSAELNAEVNEFLSQMNNCGKDNVMVIGTTNDPSLIDPALLRTGRMDKLVYVPLPDVKAREEMLKLLVEPVPHEENINYTEASEACDGMVMSDVEVMFHGIILKCAREDKDVSGSMLTKAAKTARRSVYVPKQNNEEVPTPMTLKAAGTHVKGFSIAV